MLNLDRNNIILFWEINRCMDKARSLKDIRSKNYSFFEPEK